MSAEAFRAHGREVIDWIADYLETCERFPVQSQAKPGDTLGRLPLRPPLTGEAWPDIFKDVDDIILPGITHWQSPNFFGYFPANNSYPSILGELLCAGLGVQGMLWATSPACTELEMRVLDWCAEMLALPAKFRFGAREDAGLGGGVILDTASSAALCAMIAARERATNGESNRSGARQSLIAYTSSQAHSSVEKAARICGIGSENVRFVDVDRNFAMKVEHLHELMAADRKAGLSPFFVCATVGTTSSNAIDPVRDISRVLANGAESERPMWLHVDAAMSGTAALCPEFRWIHDGLEFADSYCFNPHKWMLTNFDCDCFYVADRAALVGALSILPEYLRNQATESGAVVDYRDWQIPLGRRFRALKLWFAIRHYGVEGLQAHIREHVRLAQEFASWVRRDSNFEIAAPHPLNLVCFRRRGGDVINQRILDSINQSGRAFFTHTRLDGKLTLRLAIGAWRTTQVHIEQVWGLICEMARAQSA